MFRLLTLGTTSVTAGNTPVGGALAQRKTVALLALLAAAGERGLSRDKIVALLWPESPADRVGHRLTQLLYSVKRELGTQEAFLGSTDLRLNPEIIVSDLAEFAAALARDEPEAAVALYRGPFLDGFFLTGAPEFERWLDAERESVAERFSAALEALATAAERRGDSVAAAAWWRRLAECDPLNARVVVRCMEALATSGDPGAARRLARTHELRMREDLDALPEGAVITALDQLRVSGTSRAAASAPPSASVAILPFVNLSPDRDNEYFSDGMTEELTNALAQVPGLRVASRTSAFAFKGRSVDACRIGERLRVASLVEGSVRKLGDRIRVTAQLINAADGYHLWSQTYERTLDDVFGLQEELARAIAAAVQAPLPKPRDEKLVRPPTHILRAYTLYLRGRFHALKRTPEQLRVAIEYLEQAVEIDPSYALAYGGLAECHALLGFEEFGDLPPLETMPQARAYVERALALDPELAEAHHWRGVIAFIFEWDWPVAEAAFQRAIELKPSYSLAHGWYALFLSAMGRTDQAMAQALHAAELDPIAAVIQMVVAHVHYYAGRLDEALERTRVMFEIDPSSARAFAWMGRILLLSGRLEEALEVVVRGIECCGRTPALLNCLGSAQAGLGRAREARTILAELEALQATRYVSPYYGSVIYRRLGMTDEAVACYERMYDSRSGLIAFVAVEPSLAPLRAHPRFSQLVQKLGFPGR
jgi:TolB-like protein/Tfp pilus assembly protein PilF